MYNKKWGEGILLKKLIYKFYIDEMDDIYWINEEILSDIFLEDDFYKNNTYFYLLNLYYLYLYKEMYKEVAYLAYLISYYLFILETPFGSEFISKKYAEYALKHNNIEKYRECMNYINQGN